MRILIAGICGFAGNALVRSLREAVEGAEIFGIDNLLRPGTHLNRGELAASGVAVFHGDVRMQSDLESLPAADWVIDAAANPSVLAGVDGKSSSRQLIEHNLQGTLNLLEYAKRQGAGLILLSSSRVYSVAGLAGIPVVARGRAFVLDLAQPMPRGLTEEGIAEDFSVAAPVSLYGSTKLASEAIALEYGYTFGFPVWVNRCGVLAGAGQFGTAEQGIFSYWMHAHAKKKPLRYIGFGGTGLQVRDAMHPEDLALLLLEQMRDTAGGGHRLFNVGGGVGNAMSLAELTDYCDGRFGAHAPTADSKVRPFDVPWVAMDSSAVKRRFHWAPGRSLESILEEIAKHTRTHPEWLEISEGRTAGQGQKKGGILTSLWPSN